MGKFSDFMTGGGSAGVDLILGAGQMISDAVQAKKNREFQKEMYAQQVADARQDYQTQLADQWEFEKYRSAPNQAKLLREAGINPNGNGGQISTGGSVSTPDIRSSDVPSAANQRVNLSGLQDSMHVLNQGLVASSQLEIQREANRIAAMDAATRQFSAFSEDLKRKSEIGLIDAKTYGQKLSNAFNAVTFDNRVRQTEATLNEIQQNTAESFQRTLNLEYDRLHLKPAQIEEINAHVGQLNAAIKDYESLAKYRAQLISESAAKTDILNIEKQMKEIELQWAPSMHEINYHNRVADVLKGGWAGLAGGAFTFVAKGLAQGFEGIKKVGDSIEDYAKRSFERAKTFYNSIPKNKGVHQGYMPTYPDFSNPKYGNPLQFK